MTRQRLRRTILVVSALLLPVTLNYFSPYLMTTGAALGILTGSFIVWVVWSVAALVVGRAGCGWVCPLNGVQLLCDKATHGRRLRRIRWLGAIRFVLWGAWVAAVAALLITHGVRQADVLYLTPHVISVDQLGNLITLTMIVAIAAVPALLLGRHAFCRYLCPFAPYNIIATLAGRALHLPQLQLRLTGKACSSCGSCAKTCPMSLPVDQMVAEGDLRRTDCIMCGSCADGCSRGVIAYGFASRSRAGAASEEAPARAEAPAA
jgi:ferredoxin-type protein NapH